MFCFGREGLARRFHVEPHRTPRFPPPETQVSVGKRLRESAEHYCSGFSRPPKHRDAYRGVLVDMVSLRAFAGKSSIISAITIFGLCFKSSINRIDVFAHPYSSAPCLASLTAPPSKGSTSVPNRGRRVPSTSANRKSSRRTLAATSFSQTLRANRSYFGGQPPLSKAVGYLVVVGFGLLFSIFTTIVVYLDKAFSANSSWTSEQFK